MDGKGCKCGAINYDECGCEDVDWTSSADYNKGIDAAIEIVHDITGGSMIESDNPNHVWTYPDMVRKILEKLQKASNP